jgi:hypothetical protein
MHCRLFINSYSEFECRKDWGGGSLYSPPPTSRYVTIYAKTTGALFSRFLLGLHHLWDWLVPSLYYTYIPPPPFVSGSLSVKTANIDSVKGSYLIPPYHVPVLFALSVRAITVFL